MTTDDPDPITTTAPGHMSKWAATAGSAWVRFSRCFNLGTHHRLQVLQRSGAVPAGVQVQRKPAHKPPAADPSYRRSLLLVVVLGLALLCALGSWARSNWHAAVAVAHTDLQRLAAINAVPLALALRDARRAAESIDRDLAALSTLSTPGMTSMMATELSLRFVGDETVDLFQPGHPELLASTARDGFNPAQWAPQLARLGKKRTAILGWAYQRGQSWWLPVFFVRDNGQVLLISLPVQTLFTQWQAPDFPGENPVGLRSNDDRVLLRRPFTPAMLGTDARGVPSSRLMDQARDEGATSGAVRAFATETETETDTETNSVERLIGWAVVPGTDLRTLAAADTDNVLAQWRSDTAPKFAVMALFIVLALCGAAMSLRQLHALGRRERLALAAAGHAQALTQAALSGSRDITWQMPMAGGEMRFAGDPAQLLCAHPLADDGQRHTLTWLLAHMPAADRTLVQQAVTDAQAHHGNLHVGFSATGADGQRCHLVLNGRPVAHPAGLAPLLAGTLRDVSSQTRARAQLAQSATTLQRMCSLARIGPWQADPASGALTLSSTARAIYGLPDDEALPPWRHFHRADPATRDRVQAARDRLLADGVGYDLVLPVNLPDGSRRWVRSVAAAHYTEGQIDRVDGALQDVTEQVLAQQALDEQNTRTRLLAEAVAASGQLLLVTDLRQRITWCNDTFTRRTGYTLDDIRGKHPGKLLQRGTVPQAVNALMARHVAAQEAFTGVRLHNYSKAGEPYWVDLEVRPIFNDQGQLESFIGLQTDVTHDIEREHALRETTRRFELATAHAGLGVYEIDLVGHTRTWSEGMYRLYGFDPAGGLPSNDNVENQLVPGDRPLRGSSFLLACADSNAQEWSSEFRVVRPNGSHVWLQSRCQIERDEQGRALRAVGTTLDVTHARTVALERQARAEADARSQAKSAFLSHMSHELRTPLHAVIGYSQLINTAPDVLPGTAAPYVKRIEKAGRHLLALIDDVLELARIESGTLPIPLQAVALDDVVREAQSFIEHEAERACLQVQVSLQPVVALANVTRVRQVVLNLLSNAVKYNLAAGSVRVSVREEGDHAVVEVADTGLGMTETQLAGLYEPFNRLGRETSAVHGTGIGLAISKGLVERMGGTLAVSSRIDTGTTFTLRLPLATTTATDAHADADVHPAASNLAAAAALPLDVLCIEDNEVNALLLRETLHRLRPGWPLRVAGTGVEATQMLRDAPAALVFLDLNLPDVQGLEWLACARHAGLLQGAEVALVTADVMPQTRAAAHEAGLRHFLSKPFLMADLEHLLGNLALTSPPLRDGQLAWR